VSEQATNTIVSDAESAAALVDAQAGEVPNLDDNSGRTVVPVPVTSHLRPMPRSTESEGWHGAPAPAAEAMSAEPAAVGQAAPQPREPAAPRAGLGARVCRAADRVLWAVNRPFAWLGPSGRALVGWLAITTIVVSVLAMFLLPVFIPRRDFVVELHRQAQHARAATSAPASTE
jgi:hypothetical protein